MRTSRRSLSSPPTSPLRDAGLTSPFASASPAGYVTSHRRSPIPGRGLRRAASPGPASPPPVPPSPGVSPVAMRPATGLEHAGSHLLGHVPGVHEAHDLVPEIGGGPEHQRAAAVDHGDAVLP